eukprot:TRINITY_DN27973_c0_g1_i1.p1 TRINITY_DN27973_c0_g1~~TRINITY_DN27973_c0_g1_i1.p1  ORF type:complete len:315 (+),score=46.26 TRINITY_DN27973_c0_g1_i1:170-1114(+)
MESIRLIAAGTPVASLISRPSLRRSTFVSPLLSSDPSSIQSISSCHHHQHASPCLQSFRINCQEPSSASPFLYNRREEETEELVSSLEASAGESTGRTVEDDSEESMWKLQTSAAALIIPALAEGTSYSQASYYTSLGLFVLSVPGIWSLIKRSVKSKIVKKTFLIDGPGKPGSKPLSALAGEITSFFTRNNYRVAKQGEVVTFEGVLVPSRSQASFLVFCTLLSLASVALVLTITIPDVGENWYWLMALSPLSGVYYWQRASRKEEIQVKMVVADDEQSADVIVQGDDVEVDRLRRELQLMEKGMVYVKGLLE